MTNEGTGSLRVAVVGYGTGGQAAALLLANDGHSVEVFERVSNPGPVGAGFLLQPTGLWVMWELGLLQAALAYGAPIDRLFGRTTTGRRVMDMRYRDLEPRLFGLGLQRGAMFDLLDKAWTHGRCIHAGYDIVDVDAAAGTLTDAAGKTHDGYDLVVVADGSASRLRDRVAPPRIDRPYPWGAQWCLVPQGEWQWPSQLQQRYTGARRMVGMLPVGTAPGDETPRLSFFWSLPASVLDRGETDAFRWRDDLVAAWPMAAERLETTSIPGGLAAARYRDTAHDQWYAGRCVLLGDAAHAMSPQLGQGVNMALLDALAMRDALRDASDLEPALRLYQYRRRRHVRSYQFLSRRLTPFFQSYRRSSIALRDVFFHPLSRMPGGRRMMLRVLTGTRVGWSGAMPLPPAFLESLAAYSHSDDDERR